MGQLWRGNRSGARLSFALATTMLAACGQENDEASSVQQSALSAPAGAPEPRATAPRLLAPLSTSISTSQRPAFHWTGGPGVVSLEICGDRACRRPLAAVLTARSSARPARALPAGVVFWRVVALAPGGLRTGQLFETSAVWELTIPARESGRAESWGAIPDFNGDGFGDLAVGVKAAGAVVNGEMRIFPGGPQGLSLTPAQTLAGTTPGFGDESGPAGDLDGDGFGDLAVWSSGPPQTVTVYRGGPAGLGSPVTFAAPPADPFSQMRVLSAGDVNGDGYGDLLVGGRDFAALHLGSATGVVTTPAAQLPSAPAGSGAAVDARWPVGGADFNGDLFPDAVISGADGGLLYDGDGQTLVATSPPVTFPASFGALAGDVNGDGLADLANDGVVDIGGPQGPVTPFQAVAGAFFYQGVGDVNGDGFSDVLAQISSLFDVPEAERVYLGGTTACTSTACPTFAPLLVPGHTNSPPAFAAVLSGGLGDVNGDGFDDIAYGSPGAGAVYLFLGAAAGPAAVPSLAITSLPGFGFSFARL